MPRTCQCGWQSHEPETRENEEDFIQSWVIHNTRFCPLRPGQYVYSDMIINGRPMYERCDNCNYETHICPGCGTHLTHSGHETPFKIHNSERPYCYE